MKKSKKDKLFAAIVTIVLHVAVVLILLFSFIEKSEQLPDGGGILVQVGFVDNASGNSETIDSQPVPEPKSSSTPQPQEEMLTQEEPSINLEEQKKREEEERKRKEEEEKRAAQTNQTVASAFSKFTESKGDSESGDGSQGNQQGNSENGASSGIGGYGNISLGGRGISGVLPKPAYDKSNDEGTIVVNITVDAEGKVTEARATVTGSKGTAYHNPNLRTAAEKAARNTKFNPSNDPTQKRGTITYYFKTN